jgi:cyanophycinase
MARKAKGRLIIIGGHEDKQHDATILETVVKPARDKQGSVLIVTIATRMPQELADEYRAIFGEMGVPKIDVLDIRTRDEAFEDENVKKVEEADVIFFTGGDQVRITSQMGGAQVCQAMHERYAAGATIAGTSAGAAVMSEAMLISGPGDTSSDVRSLEMGPGLGFLPETVIDSHFAERGRIGRLLGAVAQNPKYTGLGIDEDTAIVVTEQSCFEVIGSGAVYVVDGTNISFSSLGANHPRGVLSLGDIKLHILGEGDRFDLQTRRPLFVQATKPEA